MQPLIEMIKAACQEGEDITYAADYSGRGMMGRICVAISGNEQALNETLGLVYSAILIQVFDAAMDGDEETASNYRDTAYQYIDLLTGRCWDNMGHGVIYYWPRVKEEDYSEL